MFAGSGQDNAVFGRVFRQRLQGRDPFLKQLGMERVAFAIGEGDDRGAVAIFGRKIGH